MAGRAGGNGWRTRACTYVHVCMCVCVYEKVSFRFWTEAGSFICDIAGF